jgi:hypothetical protein
VVVNDVYHRQSLEICSKDSKTLEKSLEEAVESIIEQQLRFGDFKRAFKIALQFSYYSPELVMIKTSLSLAEVCAACCLVFVFRVYRMVISISLLCTYGLMLFSFSLLFFLNICIECLI